MSTAASLPGTEIASASPAAVLKENVEQPRQVPIRRLDSLLAEGLIPQADFIKVDVEGFEKDVLLGARELLSAGVLGLHTETNFGVSPHYPKGHFATLAELALDQHLLVFDIAFNRIPRASFQRALVDKGMKPISENYLVGRPATVDVLFCRDLIDEVDQPDNYQTPCRSFRLDQLIKVIIIYELHGLNDVALDTIKRFAKFLGERLDVDRAMRLLAIPDCRGHDILWNLNKRIEAYEKSTSWRITAKLDDVGAVGLGAIDHDAVLAARRSHAHLRRSFDQSSSASPFTAGAWPLFGPSKTIRGVVASLLVTTFGAPVIGLEFGIGLLVATTAMAGDLLSSFVKRRLGLAPSSRATGLDQVPESLFPLLACRSALSLTAIDIVGGCVLFFVGELLLSQLFFWLRLRDRPY